MRILLIAPPLKNMDTDQVQVRGCMPPLDLLYLAAYLLKHHYEVKILDLYAQRLSNKEIAGFLKSFDPGLVGFSTYTANIEQVYALAGMVKSQSSLAKVVLGGIHASYLADVCLSQPCIDFIVRGEGEAALLELAECMEKGSPLENVRGIAYRSEGQVFSTPPRPLFEDITLLPWPAYQLIDFSKYYLAVTRAVTNGRVASILTMRGCPYDCSFCSHHYGYNGKTRRRDPLDVVEEIQYLYDTYKIREFQFEDSSFTCDPQRVKKICSLIIGRELKIVWNCNVRADTASDELFREMKKAGCERILLGAESGNQGMLNSMKKGITIEQVRTTVRLAKKHGIRINCAFIIGTPGETRDTAIETFKFALQLDPDYVMFSVLIPSLGSDLFDLAVKDKKIDVQNVKGADYITVYSEREPVIEMAGLTKTELLFLAEKFTRGFYMRPSYIFKRILGIRSFFEVNRMFWGVVMVLKHQTGIIYKIFNLRKTNGS